MFSSDNASELRIAIRYYRKELRRPDRRDKDWLIEREQRMVKKLQEISGDWDCHTPEAWR